MGNKIYKIKGVVQHYAWGGNQFIPNLLSASFDNKPCAEYWMGAHPSAAAKLDGQSKSLLEIIQENPQETVGKRVWEKFGELPYLFKILDVKDMLSIQVHPTKKEAEKGFDAEEAAGIPINAPHRNYKDKNHKPEVMVALSEFWLLHGFRSKSSLEYLLEQTPEFQVFSTLFRKEGYKALYQLIMEMDATDANHVLQSLVKRELIRFHAGDLTRFDPGWWVAKLYADQLPEGDYDKGIFSIYFFNIVKAMPGEAVFQGAGIPHAYLEGQNVELMANSDNVLRGGLTPKHVDVPELLKHTAFEPVEPQVMKGNAVNHFEWNYPCPVPDFALNKVVIQANEEWSGTAESMQIWWVGEGGCTVNKQMQLKAGEACVVFADGEFAVETGKSCTIFKAYVPL